MAHSTAALRPGQWLDYPAEAAGAQLESRFNDSANAHGTRQPNGVRLAFCVLAPFAAGYFLSYVFRTINALLAGRLSIEMDIGPSELGLLTSVYFLAMAAVQLPLGVWLDRYGPRRVQSICLLFAVVGATVFALAHGLAGLMVGRALIGLGFAAALMAGLKAVVLWFPKERIAFANGLIVMTGALGAVGATVPAELVIEVIGWRGLCTVLAMLSIIVALAIFGLVPELGQPRANGGCLSVKLSTIYADRRFQHLAPLSALSIGTAWSLQGLWVVPWLQDVEGLGRTEIVSLLLIMGFALSAGALALGCAADWLRGRGVPREKTFSWMAVAFIVAQTALVSRLPVPIIAPLLIIAGVGAATVLSFAMLPEYFPKEMSGRANAALNILHLSSAFLLQAATGAIIDLWPTMHGRAPVQAYQAAFGTSIALQVLALGWFLWPLGRGPAKVYACSTPAARCGPRGKRHTAEAAYASALTTWSKRVADARSNAALWQRACLASATLSSLLVATLLTVVARPMIPYIVEVRAEPMRSLGAARAAIALNEARSTSSGVTHGSDQQRIGHQGRPRRETPPLARLTRPGLVEQPLAVPRPGPPPVEPRASAIGRDRTQDRQPRVRPRSMSRVWRLPASRSRRPRRRP